MPFPAMVGIALLDTVPEDDSYLVLLVQAALILMTLACLFVGMALLQRATGNLVESPEPELDERETDERRTASVVSYQILTGCLSALVVLSIIDRIIPGWALISSSWTTVLAGVVFTAMMLPAAVAAWRWPDPTDV